MIKISSSSCVTHDFDHIDEVVNKDWLGPGKYVDAIEKYMEKRLGRPFVLVNNGTNAIQLALKMLNLPKGSKVIVPSFTFVGCVNAIILEGLTPIFCDVSEEDGNITKKTIKDSWQKGVKAILAVHYGGKPCDMLEISNLGVPIVEDAAHAIDSKINEKFCGTIGDVGCFSFDPIKNISSPDAGGLVLKDEKSAALARSLRHCGLNQTSFSASSKKKIWWHHKVVGVFQKCIPNDISAGAILSQMKRLNELQKKRKKIWDFYEENLSGTKIQLPSLPESNMQHSYFTYLIRSKKRNELANFLLENKIYSTLRWYPLHKQKIFENFAHIDLKSTERLSRIGLNLPVHTKMNEADASKVVRTIKKFLNGMT
jgi:dTDP-4-amino-4,6-dideoxygalactose transaminase